MTRQGYELAGSIYQVEVRHEARWQGLGSARNDGQGMEGSVGVLGKCAEYSMYVHWQGVDRETAAYS